MTVSRLEHALTPAPDATEEIKDGRQVAKVLANSLVEDIARLGLPVELAANAPPTPGSTLGEGQFLAIDEGNRLRRAMIGLGVGSSEVRALVQLYSTTEGRRSLVEDFYTPVKSSRKPGFGPMAGAGAAAGSVAASAGAAAGVGALTAHSQTVEGDAKNRARQIAKELAKFFVQQGWVSQEQANRLRWPFSWMGGPFGAPHAPDARRTPVKPGRSSKAARPPWDLVVVAPEWNRAYP